MLGGVPFLSQFGYGSSFKNELKKERSYKDLFDSGPIDPSCKDLYDDLSKKPQFLAFIRDSLNTIWLNMKLVDQVYKGLSTTKSFSYKILGCSFYL